MSRWNHPDHLSLNIPLQTSKHLASDSSRSLVDVRLLMAVPPGVCAWLLCARGREPDPWTVWIPEDVPPPVVSWPAAHTFFGHDPGGGAPRGDPGPGLPVTGQGSSVCVTTPRTCMWMLSPGSAACSARWRPRIPRSYVRLERRSFIRAVGPGGSLSAFQVCSEAAATHSVNCP